MDQQFQIEKNKVFNSFLTHKYYNNPAMSFELFLRSKCASNCAYCYFKKHGNELYDYNLQTDENVLNNLNIFLNWYINNNFNKNISLFSGEFICDGLFDKIMDMFYQKFSRNLEIPRPATILIADDGDFINSPILIQQVESWIEKLNSINIKLHFSISIDGKYMDENRSRGNRTNEYYKRAIDFCQKYNFYFHPMVSAVNIDKWKKNYLWWQTQVPKSLSYRLSMLEVRDDNWTSEKINQYLDFLDFVIFYDFKYNHFGDLDSFAQRITSQTDYFGQNYDILKLYYNWSDDQVDCQGMTCTIQHDLCVRMGDLAIVPCHRTSYPQFICGKFIVENNKIVDIQCENYEILSAIQLWNRQTGPKCRRCSAQRWCHGGCLGANFEATNEIFIPPDSVCNLMQAKLKFLIMKYEDMGLMPYFKKYMNPRTYQALLKQMDIIAAEEKDYGRIHRNRLEIT